MNYIISNTILYYYHRIIPKSNQFGSKIIVKDFSLIDIELITNIIVILLIKSLKKSLKIN